jgi:two-component system response regulator FlrC
MKTVLVIDDDADMREALVDSLIDEGFTVESVSDGPAGLTYLRERPRPGLILLDWNMSPMNGEAFMAEVVREPAWADIPVVLLTADARLDAKAGKAPFAAALRKPVEIARLLEVVTRQLT